VNSPPSKRRFINKALHFSEKSPISNPTKETLEHTKYPNLNQKDQQTHNSAPLKHKLYGFDQNQYQTTQCNREIQEEKCILENRHSPMNKQS
jgi:hypothetical protein